LLISAAAFCGLMAAPMGCSLPQGRPWLNADLTPDERAELVLAQMTREEKFGLLSGFFGLKREDKKYSPPAGARQGSAGYVPGIPRLGIPPQWQTDAGLGVATQHGAKHKRERTALPSGLAIAATWDPDLAYRAGAMIGAEARASGFNVLLGGGVNLARDPRSGRNFEYAGEDPLLAGIMAGAQVRGAQSNKIISTVKHFAFNDQETDREKIDVRLDPDQAQMSDLLAFQIAIEQGDPGSVMCAYNRVDGDFACENRALLTDVLRRDWRWRGYVMSDWGSTHSAAKAANAGLDQQSGRPFDDQPYFARPLKAAVAAGQVSQARIDEMARRILRSMFAKGLIDHPVVPSRIDLAAHAAVAQQVATDGAVLLKNAEGFLPLKPGLKRIAVIGGRADKGVLAGGGSSVVYAPGGNAVPGLAPTEWPGPVMYHPSAPLEAIRARASGAEVVFADGRDQAAAAALAAGADVAVVFATQWSAESIDTPLELADGQDGLVAAVAAANRRTVVVLETGGPVLMPWLDIVPAVLEAWYPGSRGGEAIAALLFGDADPSGRLPLTFPRDANQLVRRAPVGAGPGGQSVLRYTEGATVGYKWYDARKLTPLFSFGHGLSYTHFAYEGLRATLEGQDVVVSFRVRNIGDRAGVDTPQVYVSSLAGGWEAPRRLGGWQKVSLGPGESTQVTVRVDPRLLGVFSQAAGGWRIAPGVYHVQIGASARDLKLATSVQLSERRLPVSEAR
jgi:beta-glucosidase